MTLVSQLQEFQRGQVARDTKFYRQFLYYFELQVPRAVAAGVSNKFLYPLIVAPEQIRMSEPFAVEMSFTDGGGLFVEEKGQIARTIRLSGHTGWKPRKHSDALTVGGDIRLPSLSFTRDTTRRSSLIHALSGQRHFQFLQDQVFRIYGDLKRNPDTAEETKLFWHNVRDDEHWRVIPRDFEDTRRAGDPMQRYEIELLAVPAEKGDPRSTGSVEDLNVVGALTSPLKMLKMGVAEIQGAQQDLFLVQGELQRVNANLAAFLNATSDIVESTAALLDGTAELIAMPFVTVNAAIQNGLDALEDVNAARHTVADAVTDIGPDALETIREMIDALHVIGSYPSQFRTEVQAALDRFQARTSLSAVYSASDLEKAAASSPAKSLAQFQSNGTGPRKGDQTRASGDVGLGRDVPKYLSAFTRVIEQGDTLLNLATRYLGDGRNWRYLAMFNQLRAPYICEDGLPNTLGIGDSILIPSFAPPANPQTSPATLGVRQDETAEVRALGRDYKLVTVPGTNQFDWDLDAEGGSIDFKKVAGIPNLTQGLTIRVLTERGTDPLFQNVGADRVVGLGDPDLDLETGRIRYSDAVAEDPRVSAVRGLEFNPQGQPDVLVADVTAEVRGFSRPEPFQLRTA